MPKEGSCLRRQQANGVLRTSVPLEDAELLEAKWCQILRLLRIQVFGGQQMRKADLRLEPRWRGIVQAGTAHEATEQSALTH